jgi:hypothetical protein
VATTAVAINAKITVPMDATGSAPKRIPSRPAGITVGMITRAKVNVGVEAIATAATPANQNTAARMSAVIRTEKDRSWTTDSKAGVPLTATATQASRAAHGTSRDQDGAENIGHSLPGERHTAPVAVESLPEW